MKIANPGSGAVDEGPVRMADVKGLFHQVCDGGFVFGPGQCVFDTPKTTGGVCPATKDPINLATGNKFLHVPLHTGAGPFPITVSLHYNSTAPAPVAKGTPGGISIIPGSIPGGRNINYALACQPVMPSDAALADPNYVPMCSTPTIAVGDSNTWAAAPGSGWRHSGQPSVKAMSDNLTAAVNRADGKVYLFKLQGGIWRADADINGKLTRLVSTSGVTRGWKFTNSNDEVETYNVLGLLSSVANSNGLTHTYGRDSKAMVSTITDSFGRTVALAYDAANRLSTVTDPALQITTLAYDGQNNLASITFPGEQVRTYLYENLQFPNALTGVIDENGKRTVSYFYDSNGVANHEYRAGGADETTLSFSLDGKSTTVTDALNTSRTINFTKIFGVDKVLNRSQPGGAGCAAASSAMEYDGNGNVSKSTGFQGEVTKYTHELVRNLETSRTEAFGTPQSRTVTTTWHATYRLPLAIAEPKRRTTFTYDAAGNRKTMAVQSTTDATGALGMGAALTGTRQLTSTVYDTRGLVKSVTGPRTDVVDVTGYTYDSSGNLATITNAANQVTTLSNYDANGRVGRIVQPNNVTTDMSYTPRGWLATRSVSSQGEVQLTRYDYDNVGQVTKVTLADGSFVSYAYDDAHRLTDLADSAGNTIHYVLDKLGNRIREEVKDPGGTLARQGTRVYDALNRLQQQTGGQQ